MLINNLYILILKPLLTLFVHRQRREGHHPHRYRPLSLPRGPIRTSQWRLRPGQSWRRRSMMSSSYVRSAWRATRVPSVSPVCTPSARSVLRITSCLSQRIKSTATTASSPVHSAANEHNFRYSFRYFYRFS